MRFLITTLVAAAITLVLPACRPPVPIYNVDNVPVAPVNGPAPTLEQVQTAILASGTSLGWRMRVANPGLITGTIELRSHTATVKIPYSDKFYSIQYESSGNLQASPGQIHPAYNGWVMNLDRAIRRNLGMM